MSSRFIARTLSRLGHLLRDGLGVSLAESVRPAVGRRSGICCCPLASGLWRSSGPQLPEPAFAVLEFHPTGSRSSLGWGGEAVATPKVFLLTLECSNDVYMLFQGE